MEGTPTKVVPYVRAGGSPIKEGLLGFVFSGACMVFCMCMFDVVFVRSLLGQIHCVVLCRFRSTMGSNLSSSSTGSPVDEGVRLGLFLNHCFKPLF